MKSPFHLSQPGFHEPHFIPPSLPPIQHGKALTMPQPWRHNMGLLVTSKVCGLVVGRGVSWCGVLVTCEGGRGKVKGVGGVGIGSSVTGTCYGNCSANSFLVTTGLQLNHFSHHHQNSQHKFVLHCWVSLVDGITRQGCRKMFCYGGGHQ